MPYEPTVSLFKAPIALPKMDIQRLQPHHAAELQALRERAYLPGALGTQKVCEDAMSPDRVKHDLEHPNRTFGAFKNGVLVGSASMGPTADLPDSYGLFRVVVVESFRGQDLGRKLIKRSICEAAECGAEDLLLVVNEPNVAAKSLYDAFGFLTWNVAENAYEHEGVHFKQISMRKVIGTINST